MNERRKRVGTVILLCLVLIITGTGISNLGQTVIAADDWSNYLDERWIECENTFASWLPERQAIENRLTPWDGSEDTPKTCDSNGFYLINTPEELCGALKKPDTYKKLLLMNDLDMGGLNKQKWTSKSMTVGIEINGNNKTIYNLYLEGGSSLGLFSQINNGDFKLYDLNFKYADVTGGGYIAAIAGDLVKGNLKNCGVEKSIIRASSLHAGGVVGGNTAFGSAPKEAIIEGCHTKNVYVKGTAVSFSCVGNFSGSFSSKIKNCYAIDGATVAYGGHSGGFISCSTNGSIENCFTNVDIYGKNETGGFTGAAQHTGTFKNCFSSGVVEGVEKMGGFVGTGSSFHDKTEYYNCYSTSMVGMQSDAKEMGGFSGLGGDKNYEINNCYSSGEVGNLTSDPKTTDSLGGFEGITAKSTRTSCFYDKQTTAMGEYGDGSRADNKKEGVTGKLTKEMVGNGLKGDLDTGEGADAWTFSEGLYPQLSVFANPDESFGTEEDRAIARAYSMASVCTAYMSPSNLETLPEDQSKYDTVRSIRYLFPLTNNKRANTGKGSTTESGKSFDISWEAEPGYFSTVVGDAADEIPVVTLSPDTYAVTSLAPGIGWVDSKVKHTYTDSEGKQQTISGTRRLRIVPTTAVSLSDSEGVDKIIYAVPDSLNDDEANSYMENVEDVRYDHRSSVMFVMGDIEKLQNGNMVKATLPDEIPSSAADFQKAILDNGKLGVVNILVGKVTQTADESEDGEIKTVPVILDQKMINLLTGQRPAREEDKGIYQLIYRWYPESTDGKFEGNYIESSKLLTVIDPLSVTYHYNTGASGESDIYETKSLLKVGGTVKRLPPRPSAPGNTFKGWATKEGVKTGTPDFRADTLLKDSLHVYALWEPAKLSVSAAKSGEGAVAVKNADGSEQPDGRFEKNTTAVVEWTPQPGWYAKRVLVDGAVRDDLTGKSGVTFNKLDDDHSIFVEFAEGTWDQSGDWYTVATKKTNGSADCMLTQTATINKGSNYQVSWKAAAGYEVRQVLLNRRLYSTKDEGTIQITGIRTDHEVEVLFAKKAGNENSLTIKTNPDYHTVSTRSTGSGQISPSCSEADGSNVKITWSAEAGSHVSSVLIDGASRNDLLKSNEITFSNLDRDHSVEVAFSEDKETAVKDEGHRIDTVIAGGPGQISPSCSLPANAGAEQKIEWSIPDGQKEFYKVSALYVDGKLVADSDSAAGNSYTFSNVEENHSIVVVLESVLHRISTSTNYGGEIDNSITAPRGSSRAIKFSRSIATYELDSLVITKDGSTNTYKNGETLPDNIKLEKERGRVTIDSLESDYEIKANFKKNGGTDPGTLYKIKTNLEGGAGVISPGGEAAAGKDYKVTWQADLGYRVKEVKIDSPEATKVTRKSTSAAFSKISGDCSVTVIVEPEGNITTETPAKVESGYTIETGILGAAGGKITPGFENIPTTGSENREVSWSVSSGNKVTGILVDGELRDDLLDKSTTAFDSIAGDHSLYVLQNGKTGNVLRPKYTIEVQKNKGGTASDTCTAQPGSDQTITWKADSGYEVDKVLLDGVEIPEQKGEGHLNIRKLNSKDHLDIRKVNSNHTVKIQFKKTDGSPEKQSHLIRTYIGSGQGNITPSVYAENGASHQVDWKPSAGHYLTGLVIDGTVRDDLVSKGSESFTYSNIREGHEIEADFSEEEAKEAEDKLIFIQTKKEGAGTITKSAALEKGGKYSVSWKPEDGYKVGAVYVDGAYSESLSSKTTAEFDKVLRDHEIRVVFDPVSGATPPASSVYSVNIMLTGAKGTVTPSARLEEGSEYPVQCEPEKGYQIEKVTINGKPDNEFLEGGSGILKVTGNTDIIIYLAKAPEDDIKNEPEDKKPPKSDETDKEIGSTDKQEQKGDGEIGVTDIALNKVKQAQATEPGNTGDVSHPIIWFTLLVCAGIFCTLRKKVVE